jgi:hypothetical protein
MASVATDEGEVTTGFEEDAIDEAGSDGSGGSAAEAAQATAARARIMSPRDRARRRPDTHFIANTLRLKVAYR